MPRSTTHTAHTHTTFTRSIRRLVLTCWFTFYGFATTCTVLYLCLCRAHHATACVYLPRGCGSFYLRSPPPTWFWFVRVPHVLYFARARFTTPPPYLPCRTTALPYRFPVPTPYTCHTATLRTRARCRTPLPYAWLPLPHFHLPHSGSCRWFPAFAHFTCLHAHYGWMEGFAVYAFARCGALLRVEQPYQGCSSLEEPGHCRLIWEWFQNRSPIRADRVVPRSVFHGITLSAS